MRFVLPRERKEKEKTERANDYDRASWGAAVLRPYMTLPSS
jgi:hypothetical protein